MKLVAIHQPNFLPWPGFFHKWMIADAMVLLDTVQFEKNEWQNRNRIKTAQGACWITVPVHYRFPQTIREVTVAGGNWRRKLCATVEQAYAKAPHFRRYWPELRAVLHEEHEMLAELNVALIRLVGAWLGCAARLYLASEMGVDESDPTARLVALTRAAGGDAYLSGREGRNYLRREAFEAAGLALYFQAVEAPRYPQLHGPFVSHLSVLDLLFNTGDDARTLVRDMGGMEQ